MEIGNKRVYLVTDGGKLRSVGTLCSSIELALKMGRGKIGWVQLREQVPGNRAYGVFPATDAEVLDLAKELAPICSFYGAQLLINRRPDLAKNIPGVGVHLGRLGAYIETAREMLGYDRLIGYSAHSVREALEANARGVDYVSMSPIYSYVSNSTVDEMVVPQVLGLEPLVELISLSKSPVFAFGGIKIGNITDCLKIGASGVAISSSILLSEDVGASASAFAHVVEQFVDKCSVN